MDGLIYKIQDAAQADAKTQWFGVATTEHITFVESVIDIHIPELLKRCYTDISNGGFGPGYGIAGLPGGHKSSWGDIVQTTTVLRKLMNAKIHVLADASNVSRRNTQFLGKCGQSCTRSIIIRCFADETRQANA